MQRHLTCFNTISELRAVEKRLWKPHVAVTLDDEKVYYYDTPIITYRASAKLTETTESGNVNGSMVFYVYVIISLFLLKKQ